MVFVSYSRADINDVRPVVERLRRDGVECWLDESNVPVGEAFVVQLGEALARSDAFLLIDTPASRASYWVKRETAVARRFADERRTFLIARIFSPNLAESKEVWSISAPMTPAGKESLLDLFRDELARAASVTPIQAPAQHNVREGQFGQPQNWSGRQVELDILDDWWVGAVAGAWVCGSAGSGKSGLIQTWVTALEYLGYHRAPPVAVLFIAGTEIVGSVRFESPLSSFLEKTKDLQHRLVILDGFDEARDNRLAENLLQDAIAFGAKVLVSSRQEMPSSLLASFVSVDLNVMSRRDSVAFLNQMGIAGNDAVAVAQELGDHPLAVLLFSRYVTERNLQPADALQELRLYDLEDDVKALIPHERAVRPIERTVQRAIDSVSPLAREVLSSLCQIDAVELKWPPFLASRIALSDVLVAVQELAAAGLVQVDRLNEPTQLAIHDLIRNFARRQGQSAVGDRRDP